MNELYVPFIPFGADWTLNDVDAQLDLLDHQSLDHLLWSRDDYYPQVYFDIAHNGANIFLKFTVMEDDLRMMYNTTNDPVYKDTCVEFFIGIEDDVNFYDLEFNFAGTCSVGYGSSKFSRQNLPANTIANIATQSKLWRLNGHFKYCWELTLAIPVSTFIHHTAINLNNMACKLNFYKCGDDLGKPHFIAWNKIDPENQDFYLQEFFGKARFLNEADSFQLA